MSKLQEVQSVLCEWKPSNVKVHVDRLGTVTLETDWAIEVNFMMFKRLADALGTEHIDVEKRHETYAISEVTSDSWDEVTFTARNVPEAIVSELRAALGPT